MTDEIAHLPATELLRLYRNKRLSPVEATRASLERIERCDRTLNAYCLVRPDEALAAARASEQRWSKGEPRGLLDGVPVAIKDLLLTKGWPTLRGSKTVDPDQPWDEDAPSTARLREHGAVLLGKTTTPEFGWKGVTDSPLTGVTRNPWNPTMTPGGSSGGSAAAVASAMATVALGTDGGGSVRIPCGFTGLFGLKPSFGRVPAAPLSPFGTVSHVGPMTRTVSDAALVLTVIAAPDARDWHALPYDGRDYRIGLEDGVRRLRIAYSPELGYARVDPEVRSVVDAAVEVCRDLGAQVEQVDPGFDDPLDCFVKHWLAGAANLTRTFDERKLNMLEAGLAQFARAGAALSLMDYLDAINRRGALGQAMNTFHERYDLLLTPALPCAAFPAEQQVYDPANQEHWFDWTPFTFPFNLTQQPAASVPCGLTAAGLPVGLQIVGPRYADALVLRASRAFESARPFPMPVLNQLDA
ncbi:MAG: amidase [Gammaproteobacteria bacterium]|nr:amidase [Gammaproteobacteria bacterium]NIR83635.1 amidase [Gammaproteobacteria bacterium]NIR91608.1 amidase [Gammaproteobacteria bacterium]NIU04797.1 amidase [Gammaproteobacteria bacterium]NIV53147.1 amidase [Gammaproteobacteria bacterium]